MSRLRLFGFVENVGRKSQKVVRKISTTPDAFCTLRFLGGWAFIGSEEVEKATSVLLEVLVWAGRSRIVLDTNAFVLSTVVASIEQDCRVFGTQRFEPLVNVVIGNVG